MNNFYYPRDLISKVKDEWNKYRNKYDMFFPNDENLLLMMDTMYHLSLEKEESRNISAKIAYFSNENIISSEDVQFYREVRISKFEKPIEFNKKELIRLSPAFTPENSVLAVTTEENIISEGGSNKLFIWGVISVPDKMIWPFKFRGATSHLDYVFNLAVSEPGLLIASFGLLNEHRVFKLKGGELEESPIKNISIGIIAKTLDRTIDQLIKEINKEIKEHNDDYVIVPEHKREYEEQELENPFTTARIRFSYFTILKNILQSIEKKRHGGTLIMIPDSWYGTDFLNIKYQLNSSSIWNELKSLHFYRHRWGQIWQLMSIDSFDLNKTEKIYNWNSLKNEMNKQDQLLNLTTEKIDELAEFIASLSQVDGAVVITEKFEIIGFGAEIQLTDGELNSIKKAEDEYGEKTTDLNIVAYGTRHRSAIRYCNHYKKAIAFVISQDGKVKAIKKHEDNTYLWDNYIN